MSPLLLVDSSFLGYQSFHVLQREAGLTTESGEIATGVIFGFLSRILALAGSFRTNRMVFAWDSKSSVRRETFPTYKRSRREKTPAERAAMEVAHRQFDLLRLDLLPSLGFRNVVLLRGFEADDVIAAYARGIRAPAEGIIISADHDLYQCLSRSVRLWSPASNREITRASFLQETGLGSPKDWAEVKAIGGCSSDGVPGVGGVAEGSALQYLLGRLPGGKRLEAITSARGQAIIARNRTLVSLPHAKAPEPPALRPDALGPDSWDALESLSLRFGMDSFIDRRDEWEAFFDGHPVSKSGDADVRGRLRRKMNPGQGGS